MTLDQVRSLPVKQFIALKRAVELEQLIERRNNVYDISSSFNGPKNLLNQLDNEISKIVSKLKTSDSNEQNNNITWEFDENIKSKVSEFKNKYMR